MRLSTKEYNRMCYLLGKYKTTAMESHEDKELMSLIDKNSGGEGADEDIEGHVYRGLIMVGAEEVLKTIKAGK